MLYYPEPIRGVEAPSTLFAATEQSERNEPRAAAEAYSRFAASTDNAVRAGGLMRLARVHRKMGEPDAAIRVYDELSSVTGAFVAGLPAQLVASVGRASVYEETHQVQKLREEAAAFERDLRFGRWQLTINEYEAYSEMARAWLGAPEASAEPDAVARAGAAAWLWENRDVTSRRLIHFVESNPFLIVPRPTPDGLIAAIAGPGYLGLLCRTRSLPDAGRRLAPEVRFAVLEAAAQRVRFDRDAEMRPWSTARPRSHMTRV